MMEDFGRRPIREAGSIHNVVTKVGPHLGTLSALDPSSFKKLSSRPLAFAFAFSRCIRELMRDIRDLFGRYKIPYLR